MTTQETLEFIKCAKDPIYFMNTYGYIFDITKNEVSRLTMFDYQDDVITNFNKNKNNIVLKSRQMGISVITSGYVCWKLLFSTDERILVVANDGNGARRFLASVKQFMDYLPKFLIPDVILTNNTQQIVLSNGSFCKAVASGKNAGRGETLTLLILDETAFIENAEEIWMAAKLALSAESAKCIMISTPFGTGNLYHSTWTGSRKGENNFVRSEVHWTQHPVYSKGMEERIDEFGKKYTWSAWYQEQCEAFKFDRVKIAQELDLSFEGSAAVVIDNHIIERYEKDIQGIKPICYYDYKEPEEKFVGRVTNFHVWERPKENTNYLISSDIARGDSHDYSTIQVLDADNLAQVAEYQGKIAPDMLAQVLYDIGKTYNDAYIVAEANNFGLVTTLALKKTLKYPSDRIHHSKSFNKIYVRHGGVNFVDKDSDIPGFQTTVKTRPLLMSCLLKYMRDGQVKIKSSRLLDEFKTFVYKPESDKPEHADGYHDDLIFAFAIGLFIRDTEFDNVFQSKAFFKAMLDSISYRSSAGSLPVNETSGAQLKGAVQKTDSDTSWLFGPITTG